MSHELRPYLRTNGPPFSGLHPTLIALNIVLRRDEDLAMINRSHPEQKTHVFYKAEAEFPEDISDLLPSADHWWEDLGKWQSIKFSYCSVHTLFDE
jgi:hypothetical protein